MIVCTSLLSILLLMKNHSKIAARLHAQFDIVPITAQISANLVRKIAHLIQTSFYRLVKEHEFASSFFETFLFP